MRLEDFINKVPVLGAVYSLLTSEAVIASIAGVIATWVTGVEMEQPLVATFIAATVLVFIPGRVSRDSRIAEVKQYAIDNRNEIVGILERALGKVRVRVTIKGKEYTFDVPDDREHDIADLLIGLGITAIPGTPESYPVLSKVDPKTSA